MANITRRRAKEENLNHENLILIVNAKFLMVHKFFVTDLDNYKRTNILKLADSEKRDQFDKIGGKIFIYFVQPIIT